MHITEYRAFSQELIQSAEADARCIGLIAVGSMAETSTVPDDWSDHDFFLIVKSGEQEAFRSDLSWLPRASSIALAFRDTAHGLKVVYENGHLLEFAVFDPREIHLANVNRYRVLVDKEDIAKIVREVAMREPGEPSDHSLAGQFLTNLIVASGRWKRGERLSARFFLSASAVPNLARLIARHVSTQHREILDNLDPVRRLEFAYPELGVEINDCLDREVPQAAEGLLQIAERGMTFLFPVAALAAVRNRLVG